MEFEIQDELFWLWYEYKKLCQKNTPLQLWCSFIGDEKLQGFFFFLFYSKKKDATKWQGNQGKIPLGQQSFSISSMSTQINPKGKRYLPSKIDNLSFN